MSLEKIQQQHKKCINNSRERYREVHFSIVNVNIFFNTSPVLTNYEEDGNNTPN